MQRNAGGDARKLADGILFALFSPSDAEQRGVHWAILQELVVLALEDPRQPRTLVELERVFESYSASEATSELLEMLRARQAREPGLSLAELAG